MRKKVYLVSSGVKAFAIIWTLIPVSISILSFVKIENGEWYIEMIAIMISLIGLMGCYILCNGRLVIDYKQKKIKRYTIKAKTISFDEIKYAAINTTNSMNPRRYFYISCYLKNGETFNIPQYQCATIKKSKEKSMQIVKMINE